MSIPSSACFPLCSSKPHLFPLFPLYLTLSANSSSIDILASKITYTRHNQDVSLPHISTTTARDDRNNHRNSDRKSDRFFSISHQPQSSWYEDIGPRNHDRDHDHGHDDITPHGGSEPNVNVAKPPVALGHGGIVKTVQVTVD